MVTRLCGNAFCKWSKWVKIIKKNSGRQFSHRWGKADTKIAYEVILGSKETLIIQVRKTVVRF